MSTSMKKIAITSVVSIPIILMLYKTMQNVTPFVSINIAVALAITLLMSAGSYVQIVMFSPSDEHRKFNHFGYFITIYLITAIVAAINLIE